MEDKSILKHHLLSHALIILFLFNISVFSNDKSTEYLAFAEKMPVIQGGLTSLYQNVVYPEAARSARLEGKVFLLIFADETGNVDNVKIVKGIGMGYNQAAVKATRKAVFTPGKHKGASVKVKMALAVEFKLN